MRPFERRETNAFPYFSLAAWDARNFAWRDGQAVRSSLEAAQREARKPGKYRISRIDESGRVDLDPFTV